MTITVSLCWFLYEILLAMYLRCDGNERVYRIPLSFSAFSCFGFSSFLIDPVMQLRREKDFVFCNINTYHMAQNRFKNGQSCPNSNIIKISANSGCPLGMMTSKSQVIVPELTGFFARKYSKDQHNHNDL